FANLEISYAPLTRAARGLIHSQRERRNVLLRLDNVDLPVAAALLVGAAVRIVRPQAEAHLSLLDGVLVGPTFGEHLQHHGLSSALEARELDAWTGVVAQPGGCLTIIQDAAAG